MKDKRQELEKMAEDMEELKFKMERVVKQSQRRVIQPAMELISEAIRQVGRQYKYDLILRGEVVLHGSQRVDLTKLVVYKIEELAKEQGMLDEVK